MVGKYELIQGGSVSATRSFKIENGIGTFHLAPGTITVPTVGRVLLEASAATTLAGLNIAAIHPLTFNAGMPFLRNPSMSTSLLTPCVAAR